MSESKLKVPKIIPANIKLKPQWLGVLVLVLSALGGLWFSVFSQVFYAPSSSEFVSVSLRSDKKADYSVQKDQVYRPVSLGIVEEVLQDEDPQDDDVSIRLALLEINLKTPIPTVTPRPTLTPIVTHTETPKVEEVHESPTPKVSPIGDQQPSPTNPTATSIVPSSTFVPTETQLVSTSTSIPTHSFVYTSKQFNSSTD